MNYWWVNQKQTYRQEVPGGYLWSPKRKSNGSRNPFYEFMRVVAPGDLVFSFAFAEIRAIGVIQSFCYECPKPVEFGSKGSNWSTVGWKVDVKFDELRNPMRPADFMGVLAPLLPEKYAPLLKDGRGQQSLYLTRVPANLARGILLILGDEVVNSIQHAQAREPEADYGRAGLPGQVLWEEHLVQEIEGKSLAPTEKEALVLARLGQGKFKERVRRIERRCRVTHVDRIEHLRASHCKPWRDCDDEERLDGENGLLLTPSVDHLFDRGFISFEDGGRLLVSPVAHKGSLEKMGIVVDHLVNVGSFTSGQRRYLDFHREQVFLEARLG